MGHSLYCIAPCLQARHFHATVDAVADGLQHVLVCGTGRKRQKFWPRLPDVLNLCARKTLNLVRPDDPSAMSKHVLPLANFTKWTCIPDGVKPRAPHNLQSCYLNTKAAPQTCPSARAHAGPSMPGSQPPQLQGHAAGYHGFELISCFWPYACLGPVARKLCIA